MENQTITVLLEEIHCNHDTKESGHDDIYLHLYSYHNGVETDLGPVLWSNTLKMNDTGDNDAYVNRSINIDTAFVDKLRISMRDKDTKSDDENKESSENASSKNWDLIDNQEINRKSPNKGTLRFEQAGSKKGDYTLSYRILSKPIPTVRVLGVYCEQDSAGSDTQLIDAVLGVAEECSDAAAKALKKSPRPRAKAMAGGFKAVSKVLSGVSHFTQWIANALEGDDDVYMQRTDAQASADGGGFFPPDEKNYKMHKVDQDSNGNYVYNEHNTVPFLETYGEYFRIALDEGDVTIQLKDSDHGSDDCIGALTIRESDYERLKNEGAQIELAATYYGGSGQGAVYHICYSVGMEDWAKDATPEAQGEMPDDWAVQLFKHGSFEGENVILPEGKYTEGDYSDDVNDVLSSLKVRPGYQVTLYEHGTYSGEQHTYTSDVEFLGSFNDRVSAVEATLAPDMPDDWAVQLFRDTGYKGEKRVLGVGKYTESDYADGVNDSLSSMVIRSGYQVTIFEHGSYRGAEQTFTSDVDHFNSFDNKVSSIIVEKLDDSE